MQADGRMPVAKAGGGSAEAARGAKIGREEVREAEQTLLAYKQGKASLDARIIDNEKWYKMQSWEVMQGRRSPGDPEPASAWLLNCIANKHADAMDNYPAPNVLPREAGDEADARLLSAVLPVVLEQNDFEQTYSDMWWYKLKSGTGALGVFWSPGKNNGLGDIDIRELDIINLFWEPGITDIQKSRHLFHVELVDEDLLRERYPQIETKGGESAIDTAKYVYDDAVDTSKKVAVVDWYYKLRAEGREVLHFCKFASGQVLYASENDPNYEARGYYDHGQYPMVFDTLFPTAGTPAGFGYIDVCKGAQMYIDRLDQAILKLAIVGATPRFLIRGEGDVNEAEYADWSKAFVHVPGSGALGEHVVPISAPQIDSTIVNLRTQKIEELKETSGNRDFSQGGTASGVTAASAIAALQEAGSKLSRDMIKSAYRSFARVNTLCIELMRQFYQEERMFRVVGERGQIEFEAFSGQRIAQKPQGNDFGLDMGSRVPVFDIKVMSQKASPFSTVAQNERAKELYGLGFFNPQMTDQALAALEMMQFEGIEKVRERISENGTLAQQVEALQHQLMQLAAVVDATQGTAITQSMAQAFGQGQGVAPVAGMQAVGGEVEANALGDALNAGRRDTASAARVRVAGAATPE